MRTKIYLVIFALLSIFAAYTIFNSTSKNNTEAEKAFKVENFEKVTKIIVTDRNGEEMIFDKQANDAWVLNNKFPVRMHLFEQMQEALTKMVTYSPVPEIGKEVVLKQMIEGAIKVQVFKGKKLDKKIFIGGPNLTNTASHMFLEIDGKPSKRIYNVEIPGFRGFLTTRFTVNEDEWRSKLIFDFTPNEIKQVKVDYTEKSDYDDFTLTNNDTKFKVEINGTSFENDLLNDANIVNYLKLFANQQVTAYVFNEENEQYLKDSLLQVNKFADLTVTDINNKTMNMVLVDMPLNESSKQQYDDKGDPMLYDVDYKYLIFGDKKDWGVITNLKFGSTLVSPYLFLKNNVKPN